MKAAILDILRREKAFCSGETLSRELGVSRVTVWKHIQSLQALGYAVTSGPKGYRLTGIPDLLLPWEFPGREDRVHYHEELDSTMDAARRLARNGCPAGTVVIAGRQTRGRGRMARDWQSDEGGLYMTLVLRPELAVLESPKVCFAASLELARTLREAFGVDAAVKWPNDLLVDERKLAGMLSEMEADGDLVRFVNIGVGINVNNDPPAALSAVSLKQLLGREVSRRDLLAAFLERLEPRLRPDSLAETLDGVVAEWKAFTVTLNREVRVQTLRETVRGTAVDVDADGALMLRTSDGDIRRIVFGDCFHTEPAPAAGPPKGE